MISRDDLDMKILVGLDTDLYLGRVLEVADPNADSRTQLELAGRFLLPCVRHCRMKPGHTGIL